MGFDLYWRGPSARTCGRSSLTGEGEPAVFPLTGTSAVSHLQTALPPTIPRSSQPATTAVQHANMKIVRTSKTSLVDVVCDYFTSFHRHRRKVMWRCGKVVVTISSLALILSNFVIHTGHPNKGIVFFLVFISVSLGSQD